MRLFQRSVPPAKNMLWNGWIGFLMGLLLAVFTASAAAESPWDSAAASLAEQIAATLGNGPAHLTLQNISSIAADDVPAIRRSLEQALKSRSISLTANDSTPTIRITLSENTRERLWIAEITRGSDTKVVMVRVPSESRPPAPATTELTLHRQLVLTAPAPILAGLEIPGGFLALESEELVYFSNPNSALLTSASLPRKHPVSRDARGVLLPESPNSFSAWFAGVHCVGPNPQPGAEWKPQCNPSDDPWPIPTQDAAAPEWKAFYNPNRDFFTGIVVPAPPADLPAFYSASLITRPAGPPALLLTSTDGKVMLLEKTQLQPVTGTRDWGSDFVVLTTGCGHGLQAIASAPGPGAGDTLRAYNIVSTDASPASMPLPMNGLVIALWMASDAKTVFATVRHPAAPGAAETYEVDRVTATCN